MSRLRTLLLLLVAMTFLLSGAPTVSLEAAIFPPPDFILCTCKLCQKEPDTICQISPSGYSILCEDWARTHC